MLVALCQVICLAEGNAWRGQYGMKTSTTPNPLPELFIKGRYLMAKDRNGNDSIVNMHGFGQTYNPYFNGYGWCKNSDGSINWGAQYDYAACKTWSMRQLTGMYNKGWKTNWLRLHMDPHWSNDPNKQQTQGGGESDISAFSFERFKTYFNNLFLPMAEYAINIHQHYVVMRPPGVCPQNLKPGDEYQQYLIKVWTWVASQTKVQNNPYIMFELANEPVNMWDGSQYTNGWSYNSYKYHTEYFQAIVDAIRATGFKGILWIPGLCWQQNYQGFVTYPIKDDNYGFAVHCYPGWYGSDSEAEGGSVEQGVVTKGNTYADFQAGWSASIDGVAAEHPILITEMDWAPEKYHNSWGKASTGVLGGVGFGANFRYIMDKTGNVSWMLFTDPDKLALYDDSAPDGNTFWTDPEACPRQCYRWFQEYADPDWKFEDILADALFFFPGTSSVFNPNIWEKGTCIKQPDGTRTITTGQYGFGGWKFSGGLDLSKSRYLVVVYGTKPTTADWDIRLFDADNYWGQPYSKDVAKGSVRSIVDLSTMKNSNGATVSRSHIYILGFWNPGGQQLNIKDIYLTNKSDYSKEETGVDILHSVEQSDVTAPMFNVAGQRVSAMRKGQIYIKNGIKIRY